MLFIDIREWPRAVGFAGLLYRFDEAGEEKWRCDLDVVSRIVVHGEHVYAAGWDGRVRAVAGDGAPQWTQDCTSQLMEEQPMQAALAAVD